MIETVMTAQMPVGLPIKIKKNRLEPDYIREDMPRLSIVAGVHGDELQGQYICYELIRRIKEEREHLRGIVDIYPCVTPMALEIRKRNAPGALDMNAMFPGSRHGHTIEYMAAEVVADLMGSDFYPGDSADSSAGKCRKKSDRTCAKVRDSCVVDE